MAFWHFLTKNVNIIMGFLMVDAHSSHKNVDFQALGSISPWLFATFWPKMSILSWVFWWWMPTRPIKMGTFRLWVQFHHGFLALFDQKSQYYNGFFDDGRPLDPLPAHLPSSTALQSSLQQPTSSISPARTNSSKLWHLVSALNFG